MKARSGTCFVIDNQRAAPKNLVIPNRRSLPVRNLLLHSLQKLTIYL
jgi:hypothetical protein